MFNRPPLKKLKSLTSISPTLNDLKYELGTIVDMLGAKKGGPII